MPLAAFLAQAAAETGEHHGNVALETVIFGIIAFAVFCILALVTFTYRDVANRHAGKAQAYAKAHAGHDGHDDGAGHGH